MIKFDTLGHINIVVDNIEEATAFYQKAFNALPLQEFPHFRNLGFAKSAGFLEEPEKLDVSIRFLKLPTKEGLILELMEYHTPSPEVCCAEKKTNGTGCVGHISIKVTNIDEAFEYLKSIDGVRMIHSSNEYRPFVIDKISPDEFHFFDKNLEKNIDEKQNICEIIGSIQYFYFLDPYGIQWELEQGHSDMGTDPDCG